MKHISSDQIHCNRILRGLKILKIWLCTVPLRSKIAIEQQESERVFSKAPKNDYEEKKGERKKNHPSEKLMKIILLIKRCTVYILQHRYKKIRKIKTYTFLHNNAFMMRSSHFVNIDIRKLEN